MFGFSVALGDEFIQRFQCLRFKRTVLVQFIERKPLSLHRSHSKDPVWLRHVRSRHEERIRAPSDIRLDRLSRITGTRMS